MNGSLKGILDAGRFASGTSCVLPGICVPDFQRRVQSCQPSRSRQRRRRAGLARLIFYQPGRSTMTMLFPVRPLRSTTDLDPVLTLVKSLVQMLNDEIDAT